MGRSGADRTVRKLDEAEGYLWLDLPARSLEILDGRDDWATMKFEASALKGEALRALDRHREALAPLEVAAKLNPGHLGVALALGWCYKRTHRLAQAIDALERAAVLHPDEALVHYNLACYWSLAGDPPKAIRALDRAVDLDPEFLGKIPAESDFDAIRHREDFARVLAAKAARA